MEAATQREIFPLHHLYPIDTILQYPPFGSSKRADFGLLLRLGARKSIHEETEKVNGLGTREYYMASSPTAQGQVFIGPGLSRFKSTVTLLGVCGILALVLWIAIHQGASALGSTVVAILFIIGFLIYLRIVVPVPFTITLEPEALVKRSQNGEVIEVRWEDITRVKEEFFPNGTRISVTVYRKITSLEQKAKVWSVYRDDVTDLDGLAQTLKQALPETAVWQSETVHE